MSRRCVVAWCGTCTALSTTASGSLPRRRSWMALMIMGSSGGCCGRSGSALPDITMHAGAGARGASSVSATNIEIGRAAAATAAPG